jgi:hypothetical protein
MLAWLFISKCNLKRSFIVLQFERKNERLRTYALGGVMVEIRFESGGAYIVASGL